ncbi:MAG: hypothetical protein WAT39_20105 [Planctomycetota bacterium]
MFPLLAGGATTSDLVRVDIDERTSAPPSLEFEVDCTALPYAKGEERSFCYENGAWAVLRHECGIVVACSCGEFGGFVLWYSTNGALIQTLVAGDVPQTLIADKDSLLCVTGLTHLVISMGCIRTFRRSDDRWQEVSSMPLAKQADSIGIEPDGGILFRFDPDGGLGVEPDGSAVWNRVPNGGVHRYRAGVVEVLPTAAPPDMAQRRSEGAPDRK